MLYLDILLGLLQLNFFIMDGIARNKTGMCEEFIGNTIIFSSASSLNAELMMKFHWKQHILLLLKEKFFRVGKDFRLYYGSMKKRGM